jgi:hypothetical protein
MVNGLGWIGVLDNLNNDKAMARKKGGCPGSYSYNTTTRKYKNR